MIRPVLSISFNEDAAGDKKLQKWLAGWGEIRYEVEVKDKEIRIDIDIEKKKKSRCRKKGKADSTLSYPQNLKQSFPLSVRLSSYLIMTADSCPSRPFSCEQTRLHITLSHGSHTLASLKEAEGYASVRTVANRNESEFEVDLSLLLLQV